LNGTPQGRNLIFNIVGPSNHIALKKAQTSLEASQPTRNISVAGQGFAHNGMQSLLGLCRSKLEENIKIEIKLRNKMQTYQ
jgi:hypothetical protein